MEIVRSWLVLASAFLLAALSCGCRRGGEEGRSPGPLGFASDRAHETRVLLRATAVLPGRPPCSGPSERCLDQSALSTEADRRVQALALETDARGQHLFLSRAVRTVTATHVLPRGDGSFTVSYEVSLVSFARSAEHPLAAWIFPSSTDVEISDPARPVLAARVPDFRRDDGSTRVSLVFGQMSREELHADDAGLWSAEEAARALLARGFVRDGDRLQRDQVRVRIVDPWRAPLASQSAAREVAKALRESDVVYVNGHARSGLFADASAEGEDDATRRRLVFVDSCWSYSLEARSLAARFPGATLIVTDGRTTTGSVAVVPRLLDAVRARPTWGAFLRDLDDDTERRAAERGGSVDRRFLLPEVYGVIPARSTGGARSSDVENEADGAALASRP